MRRYLTSAVALVLAGGIALVCAPDRAMAQLVDKVDETDLASRLTPEQAQVYAEWRQARTAFESVYDRYWAAIASMKSERRRKHAAGIAVTPADFVQEQPPRYVGPALRPDIGRIMAEMKPVQPPTPILTVADALTQARQSYGFTPRLATEREFKLSYAGEALSVGLSKEQVVRVYALETGGRGTFNMQAGIDPETGKGRAISTALGYAQLLAANSIDELTRYGDGFVTRLRMLAAAPGVSRERSEELVAKAQAVNAMLKVARSVPREWSEHVRLATTPAGVGIHALNLDADIGPWLQVVKLRGLRDLAAKQGRPALQGAELELMNLAGPQTGLDMMQPAARTAVTANFFSPGGYYRNSIVRDKTAAELLVAIDNRMNDNMRVPGAVEFAQVFDEIAVSGVSPRPFHYETTPISVPMGLQRSTPLVRSATSAAAPAVPGSAPSRISQPRLQWAPPQFSERRDDPSKWSPMSATD